jgi:hypothetical protein
MGRKGCGKQQCNANYNQVTKGSERKESKGHVLMAVHVRLFKERVRLGVDRFLVLERVVVYEKNSVSTLVSTTRIGNLEFWENGGANGILN